MFAPKLLFKPLFLIVFLCFACTAFSKTLPDSLKTGTTKKDTAKDGKSTFKIGVDYLSNDVFMGRTAPVATPTFSPSIKYTLGFGLYFSGSLDFLPNNKSKKKLDGGDIAAGYNLDITDNLAGGVSYTKLFYNSNSVRIGSSVSGTVNANFDYDIGDIITTSVSADYSINKQGIANDQFVNFGLSHDFIFFKFFGDKDMVLISPTASANLGTQNFYADYLTKKVFKSAKKTATQNALIAQFEQNINQFKLLDYEFSLPLEYKAGHFIFQFTPTYAIVENEFKAAAAKALNLSDQPSVFYFTVGVALKF